MDIQAALPESAAPAKKRVRLNRAEWQLRLLPLMSGVLVAASLAFLALSLMQTNEVRRQITGGPALQLAPALNAISCQGERMTMAERQSCAQWKVAVVLEAHLIERRYHQANAALMVRALVKYLGFITGMLISIVGSVLILGQITGAASKLSAEATLGKLGIETVWPGLVLVTLGTVLMIVTVFVNPPTNVSDAPVYLSSVR